MGAKDSERLLIGFALVVMRLDDGTEAQRSPNERKLDSKPRSFSACSCVDSQPVKNATFPPPGWHRERSSPTTAPAVKGAAETDASRPVPGRVGDHADHRNVPSRGVVDVRLQCSRISWCHDQAIRAFAQRVLEERDVALSETRIGLEVDVERRRKRRSRFRIDSRSESQNNAISRGRCTEIRSC